MRKTIYKHPAYLCPHCFFSDLSLIRRCSLWEITIHRKLVIFQASSSLDGFFFEEEEEEENQEIFLNQGGWFLSKPLHPFKRKGISVIYSQIKALNGPLFCDSARSSIPLSFREMKLIRKGQRASQLQELWRVFFSLLSGNAAVTVVLCSWGSIKRA